VGDSATSLLFVVSSDTLIVLARRESQLEFKLLPLPGLAKVAGALANGPREAMGEELALVRPPRRRAAAKLDAFLGEDCEVATSKGLTKSSDTGRNSGTVATSAQESLQPPPDHGSFLDDVGATRAGVGGKPAGQSRAGLLKLSSPSRSSESASRHSQSSGHSKSKGLQSSFHPSSQEKRSRSPSQMRSSQLKRTQGESRGKLTNTGGTPKSSSQSSSKERSSKEYDLASQIFSQASSRGSGSQKSSSQRSSNSHTFNSQFSQLSGLRIPRQNPGGVANLPRDELTRAAGHIMGSVARSIMEGSSAMVKELVETVARHHGSGHD